MCLHGEVIGEWYAYITLLFTELLPPSTFIKDFNNREELQK